MEGLTTDWNEEKLKEICKKYGEIVKINLCQSSGTKQRGFIAFASSESALACVEGINNTAIGGEAEVYVCVYTYVCISSSYHYEISLWLLFLS